VNVEEYEKMYALETTYWWFQGRMRMIEAILESCLPEPPRPGRVLDVGCGTGLILDHFAGWEPIGTDFSRLALGYSRERGVSRLVRADVVHLPFATGSLDLILALDMMEHVERDDLLIREFNRVLRPGGFLMATVPAHPDLWSDHDIALHHFRRYTATSLRALLRKGRLRPIRFTYGICFMHPVIVLFRSLQRLWQRSTGVRDPQPRTHLIPLPRPLNALLIRLLHFEAFLLRRWNLPQGTSLVVLAQKAEEMPESG
jgi:SAM-dependent methyltransferase